MSFGFNYLELKRFSDQNKMLICKNMFCSLFYNRKLSVRVWSRVQCRHFSLTSKTFFLALNPHPVATSQFLSSGGAVLLTGCAHEKRQLSNFSSPSSSIIYPQVLPVLQCFVAQSPGNKPSLLVTCLPLPRPRKKISSGISLLTFQCAYVMIWEYICDHQAPQIYVWSSCIYLFISQKCRQAHTKSCLVLHCLHNITSIIP